MNGFYIGYIGLEACESITCDVKNGVSWPLTMKEALESEEIWPRVPGPGRKVTFFLPGRRTDPRSILTGLFG
jgi:hypothetical protein